MTWTEFIDTLVRPQVSDDVGPAADFHWTQDQALAYVNQMRRDLYTLHPEAFNLTAIVVAEPADIVIGVIDGDIDIRNQFVGSAMHFVVFLLLSEDSEDAANHALANDHLQKAIMGGVSWR